MDDDFYMLFYKNSKVKKKQRLLPFKTIKISNVLTEKTMVFKTEVVRKTQDSIIRQKKILIRF